MKLDFSQYHPLDHPIWRCRGYTGGPRKHLDYWWAFKGREWVAVQWKHATLRHEWRAYAARDRLTDDWRYGVACIGCDAKPDWVTEDRLVEEMKARPLPSFDIEE